MRNMECTARTRFNKSMMALFLVLAFLFLAMFAFGMFCKKSVRDHAVPAVCILAPVISFAIQWWLKNSFGYVIGFELLLLNALLTVIGLLCLIKKK